MILIQKFTGKKGSASANIWYVQILDKNIGYKFSPSEPYRALIKYKFK